MSIYSNAKSGVVIGAREAYDASKEVATIISHSAAAGVLATSLGVAVSSGYIATKAAAGTVHVDAFGMKCHSKLSLLLDKLEAKQAAKRGQVVSFDGRAVA